MEERKMNDTFETFKVSVETLLQRLETQSTGSRRSLDRIAKQKWKAKCRLIELRDEMEEKHRKLRMKQQEMKALEKSYREDLSHLNQALYVLQQQVQRSNEIQQQIVERFGNNQDPNMTILDKAKSAVSLCRTLLSNNPNKRYLSSQKHQQKADDTSSKTGKHRKIKRNRKKYMRKYFDLLSSDQQQLLKSKLPLLSALDKRNEILMNKLSLCGTTFDFLTTNPLELKGIEKKKQMLTEILKYIARYSWYNEEILEQCITTRSGKNPDVEDYHPMK